MFLQFERTLKLWTWSFILSPSLFIWVSSGLYHCLWIFPFFVFTMFLLCSHPADCGLGPDQGHCQGKRSHGWGLLLFGSVSYLALTLPSMLPFTEAPIGNIELVVLRLGTTLFSPGCFCSSPVWFLTIPSTQMLLEFP